MLSNGMGVALSGVVATSVRQAVTPAYHAGPDDGDLPDDLLWRRRRRSRGLVTTVIWVAATPLRHMREVPQARFVIRGR